MLEICIDLKIKTITIPELSDIYLGLSLEICAEILLNECKDFIDKKEKEGQKKIYPTKITIVNTKQSKYKEFGQCL
jgi:hypothetical protein